MWVSVNGRAQGHSGWNLFAITSDTQWLCCPSPVEAGHPFLVLLLEAGLSLEYFAAVAVFMVWQVRKNVSFLDNSMTFSFISSSSTKVSSGNSDLQRALGSLIKPRIPVLEPTIQISQSQQCVSGFLHPEPGCGVCLFSWHCTHLRGCLVQSPLPHPDARRFVLPGR